MTKRLLVSSAVQVVLMQEVLIPQMKDGFWKDHRPSGHHKEWEGVEIVVSESDKLGAEGFKVPRNYNFVNPEFIKPNEQLLVSTAQKVKPNSNFRSVKKELMELSWIVGGRLTSKAGTRTKAYRGNNKPAQRSITEIKEARDALYEAVTGVKRTAVKKSVPVGEVEIIKTTNGATVRRVKVAV